MKRALLLPLLLLCLASPLCEGQIVNRLKVDQDTFQRYAYGRMQQYNPSNLALADSLYQAGVSSGNFKYKALGLSLEFPVRFASGDYDRMEEAVQELKELVGERSDSRSFYLATIHEYCQYLIHIGRASDAMLEARAMQRLATKERLPLGKMYSSRIIGLIQSYRTNSHLAIENFVKAAGFCKEARAEQEIPNLYILIAQEYINMGDMRSASQYCSMAEEYQEFFPALRIKTRMTRGYLFNACGDMESFWDCYEKLSTDPLYAVQADGDSRFGLDVAYLRSKGRFEEALASADSLSTPRQRHGLKHGIYADLGQFGSAYSELDSLMTEKDSIYIKVQNEDMAILDAEMNNAQLREEAQKLRARNQTTMLIGFLIMFAIAFFSILLSQWQLRQNLEEMKEKNIEMIQARHAYQDERKIREQETETKIKILLSKKANNIRL